MTERLPGDLHASLAASLQHIALLAERETRLAGARQEAQDQMLHRIGSAHRCGEIDDRQLCDAFAIFTAARTSRRMLDWDAHVDIPWRKMLHLGRHLPNGPEGTWTGSWPLDDGAPTPRQSQAVVYVLFGADNEPCYVGSTDDFRPRMSRHAKDGKQFVNWQAHPCQDRDHAYRLEDRLLKQYKPYLNRKASR